MISNLIRKNRSCRRFYERQKIDEETLKGLINLARLSASGANLQPLKYIISNTAAMNTKIFSCLLWAAYLKDWAGPEEGERPSAYVIMLGDSKISKNFGYDPGIAAQSILLGAREKDLSGCMIGAIDQEKLRKILNIPDQYRILLVLAIGKPKETIEIEAVGPDGDIKYWRDDDDVHHVPKRSLEEIIIQIH